MTDRIDDTPRRTPELTEALKLLDDMLRRHGEIVGELGSGHAALDAANVAPGPLSERVISVVEQRNDSLKLLALKAPRMKVAGGPTCPDCGDTGWAA